MKFELKKNLLLFLFAINSILCCYYLGCDLGESVDYRILILDLILLLLAVVPIVLISYRKKLNHLYFLIMFLALSSFLSMRLSVFVINLIGLVLVFIETPKEKGALERLLKRRPIYMGLAVILAGVAFLSTTSVFEYLSELTYGFQMLGELLGTLFLFFMIIVCKKGHLIYKNKGSIKEALAVSLPFLIYTINIGLSLFMITYLEGHSFESLDNIIVIILLYLLVGIFEDFLTRGISLNILLDKYGKTKKGIWFSILLSSLFFGLLHFSNLFTGASFEGVLIQVLAATCIGVYFAAIYLRSGSVWAPALLHGLYDIAVSVPSFFYVGEIVDVSLEYGEEISNYSWSNLGIGLVFIGLALFLLRKSKMDKVVAMVNDKPYVNEKKTSIFAKSLMVSGTVVASVLVISMTLSFVQAKKFGEDIYNKLITSSDYQIEYGLTYINGISNYENLSDESKILIALSSLKDEDLLKAEALENVDNEAIITYIDKDDIDNAMLDIFNSKDINYVDVKYSYKTSCSYEDEQYRCVTINSDESNKLRVYSKIKSIDLYGDAYIGVNVYYIVEDLETGYLYADSTLETVYSYDMTMDDLSGGVKFIPGDSNDAFWEMVEVNSEGLIPTYLLSLEIDDSLEDVYLKKSEFLMDSITEVAAKNQELSGGYYQYNTDNYSFIYDGNHLSLDEKEKGVSLKNNNMSLFSIEVIDSEEWLDKFKLATEEVNIGNYTYSKFNNEYLIYSDEFYVIKVDNSNMELNASLLKILTSITFK